MQKTEFRAFEFQFRRFGSAAHSPLSTFDEPSEFQFSHFRNFTF